MEIGRRGYYPGRFCFYVMHRFSYGRNAVVAALSGITYGVKKNENNF